MVRTGKKTAKKTTKKKRKGAGYPRRGYGPIRRWLPSWRIVLGSFFTLIALGFGAIVGMYVTTDIPEPDDFALAQTTTVYYSDGTTRLGSFSELNRSSVPLNQVSPSLQHAVISSEDSSFYENSGVDLKGITRALVNNMLGKPTQGGSTLTQQYVERYYTGTTTSLLGKAREAILAIKIDREQSKDEILEKYLNTIYFGRGTYGIEAASKAYFGVSAKDLTLAQSAMLAGIIPAPSAWDPAIDPDQAQARFQRVLGLMVKDGWITQAEADAAVFPQVLSPEVTNEFAGTNGYLLAAVRDELVAQGFSEEDLATGGYSIVSTIDPAKQQAAVAAVAKLPPDRPANNHVGLVSTDPRNGEIYALYGGADYLKRQRNAVTQDRAQGGSTFKAFAIVEAMDSGYSPYDSFNSPGSYTPKDAGQNVVFHNTDGLSYGMQTIAQMTAKSLNTGFIKLNESLGPQRTRDMAIRLGLPENTPGLDAGVGNVLGSASPTALDMARAYGTIASGGTRIDPHIVREMRDNAGNRIYTANSMGVPVISADTATLSTFVLTQPLRPGATGAVAALDDRPVAGKTGTSSGPVSAWFIGYVPQMLTVVNMYAIGEDGSEAIVEPFAGETQVAGGNFPAQVWHDYMEVAVQGMEVKQFPDATKLISHVSPQLAPKAPTPTPTVSPTPDPQPAPQPAAPAQPQPANPNPDPNSPQPAPSNNPNPGDGGTQPKNPPPSGNG
ncbi:transglycosylase domain-containing protein [Trueperella sp. LYQ143]|uniref:transglycosylase domain-containing protein n=1 Tax=unclassified Trueperella TaxID=2630174 RepID=UPI003983D37C